MSNTNFFVLRLFTPNGRHRVDVPTNTVLRQLYTIVAEKSEFESDKDFGLYLEPNCRKHVRHSSKITVGDPESNIKDGQILYVKPTKRPSEASDTTEPNELDQKLSTKSVFQQPTLQKDNDTIADDSISENHTKLDETLDKSGKDSTPKFKAFDAFLKDRSYNIVDLSLRTNYRPRDLVMGRPNTIPSAVTLKHQPYRHVDHVEFMNVSEMNNFVHYWRYDLDMIEQRAGWLLGYYAEDSHYPCGIRAVVEGIYEPPQISTDSSVTILEDDCFLATVKSLAEVLGLSIIGWVFTHLPRDELLTATEVIETAKLQLAALKSAPTHYTGYEVSPFVTVTVAADSSNNGGVVTNAFMVSDLGMAFVRDGLLDTHPGDNYTRIQLKQPLKNQLFPEILESGKPVTSFDPDWLIVRVNDSAPRKVSSIFQSWNFPVENRKRQIQLSDIPDHLKRHTPNAIMPFADLHFILYLGQLFDLSTAAIVCSAVAEGVPVEASLVETLRTLHR